MKSTIVANPSNETISVNFHLMPVYYVPTRTASSLLSQRLQHTIHHFCRKYVH